MPARLARPDPGAVDGSGTLEFAGVNIPVTAGDAPSKLVIQALATGSQTDTDAWAVADVRVSQSPEELVLYTGPQEPQLVVPADRMQDDGDIWMIEPSVPLDDGWNGAAAIARKDSKLIGILVVEEDSRAGVVPLAPLLHAGGQASGRQQGHVAARDIFAGKGSARAD